MTPGDIIVVDTFRWFHRTEVLGDSGMSFAIGSEFQNENKEGANDGDFKWSNN
jgi:hypothetical protein